ncbi:MAG: hypothetical protein CL933_06875 [Deltaproteobacteria bacterium]|nr:hypothetical protein [Deltaproteobacteria bacterium]
MNKTDRILRAAMRVDSSRRDRSLLLGLALLLCGLVASAPRISRAEAGQVDERERWVLSAGLEMGIFGHTGKGNISGTPITGPRAPAAGLIPDLGPMVTSSDRSREEILSALVGGTFEVMTPALIRSGPRLFLDVNVSVPMTREVGLARDSEPTIMRLPDTPSGSIPVTIGEQAIEGRGHKITVQHQGPQVHAGLGAAFTVDWSEERIRIKPSIVYSRVPLDVYGIVLRPARLSQDIGTDLVFEDDFRSIELLNKVHTTFHGLGPALELEYDTGNRFGPFDIALFIKGHASYLFGDLETRMVETNSDPTAPNESAIFIYKQDRWVFRASTGLRFRWVPKSRR